MVPRLATKNEDLEQEVFVEEVCCKFRGAGTKDFIEELNKLVQVGTIMEYQEQFTHFRALYRDIMRYVLP